MRTFYLRSFGCQMNEHDAERLVALLAGEGLARVARPDEADVLVYNTCTVRRSADERFYGHLGDASRLKKDDPARRVIVCGCLPQAEGIAFLDQHPFVDAALGPQNLHRLPDVLNERLPNGLYVDESDLFSGELPACRERPFQAWVQVMSGCDNRCSYCIVPAARGRERSRTPASVVQEVRSLVADGVVEVTLLGQNVNTYGVGLEGSAGRPGFAALLARLDGIEGLRRIRFTTSHPKDISDGLIVAIAGLPSVCEHLHLPAQSGSNAVLRAMHRGYTMETYLERVAAVRDAMPEIAITTDLMVGFPGETDADFEATLELVERAAFDAAFTFVFSPRPGTPAADLPGRVSAGVARERITALVSATQAVSLRRRRSAVGGVAEVLVEGPGRHGDVMRGRTRQNVTVNFSGGAAPGEFVPVSITAATSTTLSGHRCELQGEEEP